MSLCYLLRLELAEPRRLVLAQRGDAGILGHRERIIERGERARAGRRLGCLDGLRLGLENRLSERTNMVASWLSRWDSKRSPNETPTTRHPDTSDDHN